MIIIFIIALKFAFIVQIECIIKVKRGGGCLHRQTDRLIDWLIDWFSCSMCIDLNSLKALLVFWGFWLKSKLDANTIALFLIQLFTYANAEPYDLHLNMLTLTPSCSLTDVCLCVTLAYWLFEHTVVPLSKNNNKKNKVNKTL